MKSYAFMGDRTPVIIEKEKPRAKNDTIVVKIISAAICGTDMRTYRYGSDRIAVRRTLGHEACGIIQDVGKDIRGFKVGEIVMTVPAIGCGACRWCKKGATNMCVKLQTVGFDYDGAFTEYMEIPNQAIVMGNLLRIDDTISTEQAVIAEPVACCLNGQEFLNIGTDDVVFIFGAGFIGCVHAELAMMQNSRKVILSDISDARLEIAGKIFPQITTVNTSTTDIVEFVQDTTTGMGADVIITACPSGVAHSSALEIAVPRARISLFGGIPGKGIGFLNSNTIHYKELSLFGAHASTVDQNKQILSWISKGELDLKKFISASFPLQKIEEAFESLESEKVLKVLINP